MYRVEQWAGHAGWEPVNDIEKLPAAWRLACGISRKNQCVCRVVHGGVEIKRAEFVDGSVRMTYSADATTATDTPTADDDGTWADVLLLPFRLLGLLLRVVFSTPVMWLLGFAIGIALSPFIIMLQVFKIVSIVGLVRVAVPRS